MISIGFEFLKSQVVIKAVLFIRNKAPVNQQAVRDIKVRAKLLSKRGTLIVEDEKAPTAVDPGEFYQSDVPVNPPGNLAKSALSGTSPSRFDEAYPRAVKHPKAFKTEIIGHRGVVVNTIADWNAIPGKVVLTLSMGGGKPADVAAFKKARCEKDLALKLGITPKAMEAFRFVKRTAPARWVLMVKVFKTPLFGNFHEMAAVCSGIDIIFLRPLNKKGEIDETVKNEVRSWCCPDFA